MTTPAVLALADGTVFDGVSIGIEGISDGEVVFNTAMTGYHPHIGNTGINSEDMESAKVHAAGLVIRDLPIAYNNWRAEYSLETFLRGSGLVAIADLDTRKLTRILREKGAQNGCIHAGTSDPEQALAKAREFPGLKGMDLAKVVSTREPYQWNDGTLWPRVERTPGKTQRLHVVAMDFGIKRNILRILSDYGCRMTVVPATTTAEDILRLAPDGVFLSNGPGDPEPCDYAIATISRLLEERLPIFGICLGHQLLALASGASTVKMKFGHHGANHPVQELAGGRVMITSQNHGFAVDEASLPDNLAATHRSLFDGSLQGIERSDSRGIPRRARGRVTSRLCLNAFSSRC